MDPVIRPMFTFEPRTLLNILEQIFQEIKAEYEIVLNPESLSSPASPELPEDKGIRSKSEDVCKALDELEIEESENETPTITNSCNKSETESLDFIFEGFDDEFVYLDDESNFIENPYIELFKDIKIVEEEKMETLNTLEMELNEMKNIFSVITSAMTSITMSNDPSEDSDIKSVEEIGDDFESDDENEMSIIEVLEYINTLIHKTDDEIKKLKDFKLQSKQLLLKISKACTHRKSKELRGNNIKISKNEFEPEMYRTNTSAENREILERASDRNMTDKSNMYKNYIMASRVPQKKAAILLHRFKAERNSRSVFVENIDFPIKKIEVVNHFYQCGRVESVFVLCEQKGYALIEFNNVIAAHTALAMNGTLFKGHEIKVTPMENYNDCGLRITRNGHRGTSMRRYSTC